MNLPSCIVVWFFLVWSCQNICCHCITFLCKCCLVLSIMPCSAKVALFCEYHVFVLLVSWFTLPILLMYYLVLSKCCLHPAKWITYLVPNSFHTILSSLMFQLNLADWNIMERIHIHLCAQMTVFASLCCGWHIIYQYALWPP